jgi:hypothetical protein
MVSAAGMHLLCSPATPMLLKKSVLHDAAAVVAAAAGVFCTQSMQKARQGTAYRPGQLPIRSAAHNPLFKHPCRASQHQHHSAAHAELQFTDN